MVTDGQVSELRRWLAAGKSLAAAARMASMDKKTARSYRDEGPNTLAQPLQATGSVENSDSSDHAPNDARLCRLAGEADPIEQYASARGDLYADTPEQVGRLLTTPGEY